MELAQHLCVNLIKQYPNDMFVAIWAASTAGRGNGIGDGLLFNMNKIQIFRLRHSSAKAIDDSALKSLLHRVVFESKSIINNIERATNLLDQINKMLPDYNKTVFVTDANSNHRPEVYGSHKGLAYFWEPEFGTHVTVVLY